MHQTNRPTAGLASAAGAPRAAAPRPVRRRSLAMLVLALALSIAGQAWRVQAAPLLRQVHFNVVSPPAPICAQHSYPFMVTVLSTTQYVGSSTVPKGPYSRNLPNVWIDATAPDANIGFIMPSRNNSLMTDGAGADTSSVTPGETPFTFYAKKAGTTTLYFEALVDGAYVSANVPVEVEDCEIELTMVSTWYVPGEAQIALVATIQRAPLKADELGHLTGTGNVDWYMVTGQVGDCAAEIKLAATSQVDLTGQLEDNEEVTVNVTYRPAQIILIDTCTNPEATITRDITLMAVAEALKLRTPAAGATFTIDHQLKAPETVPGTAVGVIRPAGK